MFDFINNGIRNTIGYFQYAIHIFRAETNGRILLEELSHMSDPLETYSPEKYTMKELKEVVGKTPFDEWTDNQISELNRRFRCRQQKHCDFWAIQNEELRKDRERHPEKYKGIMGLVVYGCADDYITYGITDKRRSVTPNYYRSYKALNKEDDEIDDEYRQWYFDEYDKLNNKIFERMFGI